MADGHAGRFIGALHQLEDDGTLDPMVELFSDDAELANPTDGAPHRGRQGAETFWTAYRDSFREIHSEFRTVTESDGAIMLEWTSRGRLADGAAVEYEGVSVVEHSEGRIRRFRAYFDPSALGDQITDAMR